MSDENTFVGFTNFQRNTFFAFIPAGIFTCSKLTTGKKRQCVKPIQSYQ